MNASPTPSRRDLLLFLVATGGIVLAVLAIIVFGTLGLVSGLSGDQESVGFAVWTIAGLIVLAAALAPGAYWAGRAAFGDAARPASRPGVGWLAIALLYPVCLAAGGAAFARSESPGIVGTIALAGTAVGPVLAAVWIVRRLGPALTPTRAWGHFSIGLTGMPLAALILEFVAILPMLVVIGMVMLAPPEGSGLRTMMEQALEPGSGGAVDLASALLASPLAVGAIFGYVSLVIPFLEEGVKTMAIWPFLRSGLSDAQAFLGGALGGAGYALFEALFLTQPGESWVLTTVARSGATLLHMMTAATTSWGLMQGARHRRYGLMLGAFAFAIAMHAAWNAAAVTIGIASIPLDPAALSAWSGLASLAPFLLGGLIGISIVGLTAPWRRLLKSTDDRST